MTALKQPKASGRRDVPDLSGRTVLITGGNSGIGKATAAALTAAGASVVITARDPERGAQAVDDIRAAARGRGSMEVRALDLARLASVRAFAAEFLADHPRLDVLILNAGLTAAKRTVTQDGFETLFQVNHLSHFLLTHLLQERLVASAPARVVVVSSSSHRQAGALDFDDLQSERGYVGLRAYARTKLANVLFTRELARRLDGTGVTANALHPGTVRTGWGADGDAGRLLGLGLFLARWVFLSPEQGARTSVYLAGSPQVEGRTGGYYVRRRLRQPGANALDDAAARRLWQVSEQLLGLDPS